MLTAVLLSPQAAEVVRRFMEVCLAREGTASNWTTHARMHLAAALEEADALVGHCHSCLGPFVLVLLSHLVLSMFPLCLPTSRMRLAAALGEVGAPAHGLPAVASSQHSFASSPTRHAASGLPLGLLRVSKDPVQTQNWTS